MQESAKMVGYGIILFLSIVAVGEGKSPLLKITGMSESLPTLCLVDYMEDIVNISIKVVETGCQTENLNIASAVLELYKIDINQFNNTVNVANRSENIQFITSTGVDGSKKFQWESANEDGRNIGVYAIQVTVTIQGQQPYINMGYFVIGCMVRAQNTNAICTKGNSVKFLKGQSGEVWDLRRCNSVTSYYRGVLGGLTKTHDTGKVYSLQRIGNTKAGIFNKKSGTSSISISLSRNSGNTDATEIVVDEVQRNLRQTFIRRRPSSTSGPTYSSELLSDAQFRDLWISWGDNEIRFGKGSVPYREQILRWDMLTPDSTYMFIAGFNAEWKFEIDICQQQSDSCDNQQPGQHWYYDISTASCTAATCSPEVSNCFKTEESCGQGCSPNIDWHYLGCYRSSQETRNQMLSVQLPDMRTNNTIDSCISRCRSNSNAHLYAAMRNGYECHCGDKLLPEQKRRASDCEIRCPGMSSQRCGAELYFSVYAIKGLPYNKTCSSSKQCDFDGAECSRTCVCGALRTYNPTLNAFDFKNDIQRDAGLKFSYSSVPTAGTCTVQPQTGFALLTNFSVNCVGFSVRGGLRLTFTMMSNTVNSFRKGSLFCSGCNSSVTDVKFPVGDSDNDYRLYILVSASADSGASVDVYSQVTVKPPEHSSERSNVIEVAKTLLNATSKGKSSTIQTLLETGKQNDAVQYLSIISSSLNAEPANDTSSKTEIRKVIVSSLENVTVDSYTTVSSVTEVLNGATQEKSELSVSTQAVAIDLYDSLADSLKQYSAGNDVQELEKSAGDILVGVTRLLDIRVEQGANDTLKDSFVTEQVKNWASKLLGTVNKLGETLLISKTVNDAPTILQTDTATVQIQKLLITDLIGHNFTVDDNSTNSTTSLVFPSSMHDLGLGSSRIGIQMLHMKINPYVWNESAQDVNTDVLSLELKQLDNQPVSVHGLSEPLTITMKLPDLESPLNSSLLLYIVKNGASLSYNTTWSNVLIFKFTIPKNKLTVLSLTLISQIQRVKLLITETRKPSFEGVQDSGINYPDQFNLLKGNFSKFSFSDVMSQNSSNIYFTYKENADITYNGIYFVGIAVDLNDRNVLEDMKVLDKECLGNETATSCTARVEITLQFATKTLACSYWDTQSQSWSTEGCEVSPFSTSSQLECFCTHLTAFAGGVFVLPNFVNPADIELFLTFFDNPIVVTAVVVVWILYFFLIYWARQADRKDLERVGVIAIGDVDMVHKHMYLVCVVTGWWAEAGTSANVFFYMTGTDGKSKRIKLTSAVRPCFQTGYEDWFLIATEHSLGDLQEVTMWHDNAGRSPHWYLSQVFVKDLHEKRSWTFIYNDWLAVDRGSILRTTATVKATTREQLKLNKKHNFLVKSTQDLRNTHIWISIFSKTARSTFTRAQRLTCALSLLLTTMLTNIMFYGIPTDDPEDQVSTGNTGFAISLSSIVIGIQSSLIMFPINLIIMQLFLKLKSRPAQTEMDKKAKSIFTRMTKRASQVVTQVLKKLPSDFMMQEKHSEVSCKESVLDIGRWHIRPAQNEMDKKAKSVFTRMTKRASQVVTQVLKKLPSDFMLQEEQSEVSCKESMLDIDHPIIPVDKDASKVNNQSKAFKESGSNACLAGSFNSYNASPSKSSVDSGFVVISETKDEGKILPWWFLYITWTLVLIISLVCSYFIMLYGLKYGYQRSLELLVSFFTGFSQSAFITQPLKVLAVAIVITLIFKRTVEFEDYGPEVRLDEDDVYTSTVNKQEEPDVPYSQPLSTKLLQQIRKRVHLEWLMNITLRDIGLYLIYMAVVSIVVYGHSSVKYAYRTTVAIEDYMVNSGCVNLNLCFFLPMDVATYYQYLNDVAVPCLADYAISDHEYATPGSSHFLIGPWRLRQLRVASGTCGDAADKLFKRFNMNVPECTGHYSLGDEEKKSFNMSWAKPLSEAPDPPTPWTHQSAWKLKTIPFKATLATYSGGGYIVTMPSDADLHHRVIQDLWNSDWIDEKTRAVFLEFTLYNPNADLFSVAMIVFEFSNNGAVFPFYQIFSTQLYYYSSDFSIFVAVCECLFLIFNITFAVIEWKKLRRLGWKEYFQDAWSYVEWIQISLSFSVVGLFFQRIVSLRNIMEDFRENNKQKYISFYTVISWDYILGYVMAFLVAVVTFKAIKLLRFYKRTYMVADTVAHSKAMILSYLAASIIFGIAFSHFGTMAFGKTMENYRDMITSLFTVFNFSIGVSDLPGLQKHSRVLGPIFFVLFVCIMQLIFFTVFMAILDFGISESKVMFEKRQNQFELLEYIVRKIKTWANLK